MERCAEAWELTPGRAFEPGGYCAYVAPVRRANGSEAVLKISLVDRENRLEADALELLGGDGAVRLLARDDAVGALLLERLRPGVPLSTVADERAAIGVAAGLLRRIALPLDAAAPFDPLWERARQWAAGLDATNRAAGSPCEQALVDEARVTLVALAGSPPPHAVLVHQDLHLGNVLAAEREPWLAIDPKPLAGELAFDAASLLRDWPAARLAGRDVAAALRGRLEQLVDELALDRARTRGWALGQTVELGLWSHSVGDAATGERLLRVAQLVAALPA